MTKRILENNIVFINYNFNVIIITVNLIYSPNELWFVWTTLGWGIGLFFHAVKVFNFQTSKHETISGFNLVRFFLRITVFPKFVLVSVLRVEDVKLAVEDLVNYKDWQQNHPNNDGGHEYKTFVPFVVFTIA